MDYTKLKFQTRQMHAGLNRTDSTGSRGVAIYPTAAYRFSSCDKAAALFDLSEGGNIYTRLQNPTTSAYEERVAALYGGVGALAVSSGMAAILITVTALAGQGDNIVASPYLYGGTYNQFRHTLRRLGIDFRIAPDDKPSTYALLIDDRTKGIYVESMGNPTCAVADMEAIAAIAHKAGIPFIVDNTFGAGGYLCNPFDWGADIIVDSATKWIGGHGTTMGGVIIDSGRFDWTTDGKFPAIAGPSEGYHGLDMHKAFGNQAFIVKCRVDGLRDFGTCPSPFDSYLMLLGLETLSLRVKHQAESTRRVAEALESHPKVKNVSFVGFPTHPYHELAMKYFNGRGCVLTVELKGSLDSTMRFVESLQLAAHMTMIGDSITVVTHPASTTHKQLSEADLEAAGVTPTLLRISVGLEDPDDIIADFTQALDQIEI